MKAFQIKVKNKLFDYRKGEDLDLNEVKSFFENKGYKVAKLIPQERHICALLSPQLFRFRLRQAQSRNLFLKLSRSYGISIVTENEMAWNDAASPFLPVPKNYDRGYFKNNYFYLITEYFDGPHPTASLVREKIDKIIDLSEKIMLLLAVGLATATLHHGI